MTDFKEMGLSEALLLAIEEQGYERPMPVQEQVIPWLLKDTAHAEKTEEAQATGGEGPGDEAASGGQPGDEAQDLVALAQTGTGKTAAYGLPLLQWLCTEGAEDTEDTEGGQGTKIRDKGPKHRDKGEASPAPSFPSVLILSPTRELCLQIADDLQGFASHLPRVRILAVYGGANIEPQIRALRHGVDIIVATPGRLVDLMKRKRVAVLDKVRWVVLDEADEMLSMGFKEDLDDILSGVPDGRRTLLFSATMSKEIERIARQYLRRQHVIQVGSRNEGAENVSHVYYMVQAKDKYLALKRVVDYYPRIYAIIFCRTRLETQEVADKLIRDGYNADALHGELSQQQRDLTMQRFRQHRVQLLVATDVAARGLDVDDLTHVINYGMPDDTENYTHRSGRTGRAGKKGTSISIIHSRERAKIRQIEQVIHKDFVRQALPEPRDICGKQLYHVIDDIERVEVDEEQIAPFMEEVTRRWEWLDKEDIVKRVLSREFGRFLRYYANAPEIEEVSEKGQGAKAKDKGAKTRGKGREAEEGYTRLFLSVSKIDGYFAREIIKLINDHVEGDKVEIGRIDLLKNISFVEVAEEDADRVLRGLRGMRIKGRPLTVDRADTPREHKTKKREAARTKGPGDGGGASRARNNNKVRQGGEKPGKQDRKNRERKQKPSREERGYTEPRGRKFKKEDWMKFLHPELND